jgi:hypothetical protein
LIRTKQNQHEVIEMQEATIGQFSDTDANKALIPFVSPAPADPFEYRQQPPVAIFAAFLTTHPLRELLQSKDKAEVDAFAQSLNIDALKFKRNYRTRVEEYRRLDAETLRLLLSAPKMLAALEAIARFDRSPGDGNEAIGRIANDELVDGYEEMARTAVQALPWLEGTMEQAILADRFRVAEAGPVMLTALLAAQAQLELLSRGLVSAPDESVMEQIDAAINDAHGTPIPPPDNQLLNPPSRVIVSPDIIAQAERENYPVRWMYISFADEDRGFLGACIILANGPASAIHRAWELGINPGGQVMSAEIGDQDIPGPEFLDRLLTKEEIRSFWPDSVSLREMTMSDQERIKKGANTVCQSCNEQREERDRESFDNEIVGDD